MNADERNERTQFPGTWYVIFSESRGVFLDNTDWSYDEKVSWAHDRVRTWEEKQAHEVLNWFRSHGAPDAILVRVEPDCKFALASLEALEKANLPIWEYDRERVEREFKPVE